MSENGIFKDHICEQNSKKLRIANSKIKSPSNLLSSKVFKCSEQNNLDTWSFYLFDCLFIKKEKKIGKLVRSLVLRILSSPFCKRVGMHAIFQTIF